MTATIEELLGGPTAESRNLRSIVDRVRPAVETLLSGRPAGNLEGLMKEAVRANVRASASHLRHGSELLERLIQQGGLRVVGAVFSRYRHRHVLRWRRGNHVMDIRDERPADVRSIRQVNKRAFGQIRRRTSSRHSDRMVGHCFP